MFKVNASTIHKISLLLKNIYDKGVYICYADDGQFHFAIANQRELTRLGTGYEVIDESKIKDHKYVVDINRLGAFAKASGGEAITFRTHANKLSLEAKKAKLDFKAQKDDVVQYDLKLTDPTVVELGDVDFNSIARRVGKILDGSRFGMFTSARLLIKDKKLHVMATDDYRILIGTIPLDEWDYPDQDILIHQNTWSLLEKLDTDINTKISLEYDKTYYAVGATTNLYTISFIRQRTNDKFPDLTQFFKKEYEYEVSFPLANYDSIAAYLKASNTLTSTAKLVLDDDLTIVTSDDLSVTITDVVKHGKDTESRNLLLRYFVSAMDLVRSSLTKEIYIKQANKESMILFMDANKEAFYKVLVAPLV